MNGRACALIRDGGSPGKLHAHLTYIFRRLVASRGPCAGSRPKTQAGEFGVIRRACGAVGCPRAWSVAWDEMWPRLGAAGGGAGALGGDKEGRRGEHSGPPRILRGRDASC